MIIFIQILIKFLKLWRHLLIQNPTARSLDEGTLAFLWSHNDPYLRGSIVAYPFGGLKLHLNIQM